MSDPGLEFDLGEMADTIRDTTGASRATRSRRSPPRSTRRTNSRSICGRRWASSGCTASPSRRNGAGLASAISSMSSRRRKWRAASASVGLSYGAHSNLCVNQIRRWAQ